MISLDRITSQAILGSVYNAIVAIDSDGIITYFSKTSERIFDIPAHRALHRPILEVLQSVGGKLVESLRSGKAFYAERLKGKDVTLISNITPIRDNGEIIGVVSVFQEISESENLSKELDYCKDMKNWFDTIIDSSFDGLFICDRDGKVLRINKASERIGGITAKKLIGRNVKELVAEGIFDKSVTLEVLKKKTSVTMIQHVKGGKRVLVTGNPIFDETGEIAFVVTNDRDITELDHLRDQLHETQTLAKEYISKLAELELKGIDLHNILFRSREMERVIDLAIRIAVADSTVLILGESGVGKGIIAKLIHKHSDRSQGPFIRVDCAGIPDALIESELFGYERGAFTGAKDEGKPGFIELANNGTLFLDEVGEIPLTSQSKFLRFLEDHEVIRVGGTEQRKINVRVITATNKNLEQMVSSKLFRGDLFYRINVIPINIPPLKERKEDIVPLALHFLGKLNETYQRKKILSPEVVEVLYEYDFPGNVRELANIIERLVVAVENDRIELKDLPNSIKGYLKNDIPFPTLQEDIPLKDALKQCENRIIERTIKKYGSQRRAAKVLKIHQATVSRKIKKNIPSL